MESKKFIKYTFLMLILANIAIQSLSAQSRYFDERYLYTQAQLNPQLINPGAYGANSKHEIIVNYRDKWAGIDGSPSTITLSYNGAVGNRLGLGVNVLRDKFGVLETTKGAIGLSYSIVSETNQFGIGISAEYIKHGLSGFGNANPADPNIIRGLEGVEYFDASFGIYGIFMKRMTYGLVIPSAISSRITESPSKIEDREVGVILQFGYKLDIQKDITFNPGLIMKKLANVPTHLDLNFNFGFLQDKLVAGLNYTIGADKRLGFLIGTKLDKLNFYYSYNTSSHLIQDYNNGSHEVTLGVSFGGK